MATTLYRPATSSTGDQTITGDVTITGDASATGSMTSQTGLIETTSTQTDLLVLSGNRNNSDSEVGIQFKDRTAQLIGRIWTDRIGGTASDFDLIISTADIFNAGQLIECVRFDSRHTAIFNADSIIINTAKTPSSASDDGIKGQIAWDASFIYVCTATDAWERVAIASW